MPDSGASEAAGPIGAAGVPPRATRSFGAVRVGGLLLLAVLWGVLGWWLAAKLTFFDRLYFSGDFNLALGMSRSLFEDGLLLYEWHSGFHSAIHNYYTILLLAPLTMWLDAPGLFLGLALLLGGTALAICLSRRLTLWQKLFLGVGLCGPVGHYIFDDPLLGFHPDLLLPPLTVLLALAVTHGRRTAAVLLAILVFLTKEEGALILAALWLLWRGMQAIRMDRPVGLQAVDGADLRRAGAVVGRGALLGFGLMAAALGLIYLNQQLFDTRYEATQRTSDFARSLWPLLFDPAYWAQILPMHGLALVFCLGCLLWRPRALVFAPLLILAVLPIFPIAMVADAGYRVQASSFGMWPAFRLAAIWGTALAAAVFSMERLRNVPRKRPGWRGEWPTAIAAPAVLGLQIWLLPLLNPAANLARWVPWFVHEPHVRPLSPPEWALLDCLSGMTTRRQRLVVDFLLEGPFDHAVLQHLPQKNDPPTFGVCWVKPPMRSREPCPKILHRLEAEQGWEVTEFRSLMFGGPPAMAAAARRCVPNRP